MIKLLPWLEPYYQNFIQALDNGRLTPSVIIGGSAGQGVYNLALYCAKAYLCQHRINRHPCGQCRSCTTFEAMSHHDLRVVMPTGPKSKSADKEGQDFDDFSNRYEALLSPDIFLKHKKTLRVDALRRMNDYVYESSVSGPCKVCLIADAQYMNESAANAILKTFEEPPANTLLILVSDNYESLLPTILSRGLKMPLMATDTALALQYLEQNGHDVSLGSVALSLCDNAPLEAAHLIECGRAEQATALKDALCEYVQGRVSVDDIIVMLKECALDTNLSDLGRILTALIVQIIKYKAGVGLASLPLLDNKTAAVFAQLKADRLFGAAESLKYLDDMQQGMAIRAPYATLRTFLARLLG